MEIKLKDVLFSLAENMLPARSGRNKILEVIVKMTGSQRRQMFVKIIFWHPNSYMMVATSFDETFENIKDDSFKVQANHDSTWQHDGFCFLRNVIQKQDEITIPSFKIVEVEDAFTDDKDKNFYFKRK